MTKEEFVSIAIELGWQETTPMSFTEPSGDRLIIFAGNISCHRDQSQTRGLPVGFPSRTLWQQRFENLTEEQARNLLTIPTQPKGE